jgi:hypothetical protein
VGTPLGGPACATQIEGRTHAGPRLSDPLGGKPWVTTLVRHTLGKKISGSLLETISDTLYADPSWEPDHLGPPCGTPSGSPLGTHLGRPSLGNRLGGTPLGDQHAGQHWGNSLGYTHKEPIGRPPQGTPLGGRTLSHLPWRQRLGTPHLRDYLMKVTLWGKTMGPPMRDPQWGTAFGGPALGEPPTEDPLWNTPLGEPTSGNPHWEHPPGGPPLEYSPWGHHWGTLQGGPSIETTIEGTPLGYPD